MTTQPSHAETDAIKNMTKPEDLYCIRNTEALSEQRYRRQTSSFTNILFRLTCLMTNTVDYDKDNKPVFLKPFDIFSMVKNNESLLDLKPEEKIYASLFQTYPLLSDIFKKDTDFSSIEFLNSISDSLGFKGHQEFDTSSIHCIPENPKDLFKDIESLMNVNSDFVEDLGLRIMTVIFDKSSNPIYHESSWNSFHCVFGDISLIEFNESFFYKMPRTSDASSYGHLDMAYHSYINNSDILFSLMERYKEILLSE